MKTAIQQYGRLRVPIYIPISEGIEPEPLKAYFERTRPHTPVPAWIGCEIEEDPERRQKYYDEAYSLHYTDFVIRLLPVLENLNPSKLGEVGTIEREFRKLDRCPLGLTRHR